MTHAITDQVPRDCAGAREIGFSVPERYNASRILFDNLARGNPESVKWGALEVGDLTDKARLREVFARYRPAA